ncbi:MAG: hypothetical protein LH473_02920 [Chitinophagales bacterium]|nr:hypothetical protein [Chitinophagales bacterium]
MKNKIANFLLFGVFTTIILLIIVFTTSIFSGCNPQPQNIEVKEEETLEPATFETNENKNDAAADLKTAMRKLWEDHITWTRNVIICLVDSAPGGEQAVKRLMNNQEDIGNAIKPYYGDEAGNKLTDLLHTHIAISANVVKAAKAGNKTALDEANKNWYANADEISSFLSAANPAWGIEEMKTMMHDHLKLTTDEAVARIKKNYNADVDAYDKVHDEILKMADMLADGIVKQFPNKFKDG